MSRHDDRTSLRQMLDHAAEAVEMSRGRTPRELDQDRQLNLALVRLMEVVGEAAARVSPETRKEHPSIPWPRVVALRNRLIHGYDEVDFDVLWKILREDMPQLIVELQRILDATRRTGPP
ncbi:MAG: DUF86 domain-containing protein [Myxococcales bacterium]|nr:MAG: DUF86 domain-containing protein [Myxococcales bacterium]